MDAMSTAEHAPPVSASADGMWHTLPPLAVLERLDSGPDGLTEDEGQNALVRFVSR